MGGCLQVEARQKLLESREKEEDEGKRESINEDAPGNFHCRKYAVLCYCVVRMTALLPQSGHVMKRQCSCSSLLGYHECTRSAPNHLPCPTVVHLAPSSCTEQEREARSGCQYCELAQATCKPLPHLAVSIPCWLHYDSSAFWTHSTVAWP